MTALRASGAIFGDLIHGLTAMAIQCRAFGAPFNWATGHHGLTAVATQCRAFGAKNHRLNPFLNVYSVALLIRCT